MEKRKPHKDSEYQKGSSVTELPFPFMPVYSVSPFVAMISL